MHSFVYSLFNLATCILNTSLYLICDFKHWELVMTGWSICTMGIEFKYTIHDGNEVYTMTGIKYTQWEFKNNDDGN